MLSKNIKLKKEIALRLEQARKQAGISAREMAMRMGITYGAYKKNESALTFPGLETFRRLAVDLDISMDWLLFEKPPMHHSEKSQKEQELEQAGVEMQTRLAEMENRLDKAKKESVELKKRLEEAEKEAAELKRRMAGEREQREKAAEQREKDFDMRPDVRELLAYMEQDMEFYHRLMLNFHDFRSKKKGLSDMAIEEASSSPPRISRESDQS